MFFVYGHNDRKDRKDLWESIVSLSANIEGAWVTLRDFNAIMDLEERNGQPVKESESVDMHEIMYGKVWSGGCYV